MPHLHFKVQLEPKMRGTPFRWMRKAKSDCSEVLLQLHSLQQDLPVVLVKTIERTCHVWPCLSENTSSWCWRFYYRFSSQASGDGCPESQTSADVRGIECKSAFQPSSKDIARDVPSIENWSQKHVSYSLSLSSNGQSIDVRSARIFHPWSPLYKSNSTHGSHLTAQQISLQRQVGKQRTKTSSIISCSYVLPILASSSGVRSLSVFQLPAKWWIIRGSFPSFGSSLPTCGEAFTRPAAQTQTFHSPIP